MQKFYHTNLNNFSDWTIFFHHTNSVQSIFWKELPLEYYFEAALFNWTCCVVGAWTIGTFLSRFVHWLNLNQAAVARFPNVRHMSSYSTHKATDQKSAHLPDEAIDLFENLLKFLKILLFSCTFCGVLILILYAKW